MQKWAKKRSPQKMMTHLPNSRRVAGEEMKLVEGDMDARRKKDLWHFSWTIAIKCWNQEAWNRHVHSSLTEPALHSQGAREIVLLLETRQGKMAAKVLQFEISFYTFKKFNWGFLYFCMRWSCFSDIHPKMRGRGGGSSFLNQLERYRASRGVF